MGRNTACEWGKTKTKNKRLTGRGGMVGMGCILGILYMWRAKLVGGEGRKEGRNRAGRKVQ